MRSLVTVRNFGIPSLKKIRQQLSLFVAPTVQAPPKLAQSVIVRSHSLPMGYGRKTLYRLGALKAPRKQSSTPVLLYRVPQPVNHLRYPVFTPFRRHVRALDNKVAPVIPVGGGSTTQIELQHYLGLALMQLGGIKV